MRALVAEGCLGEQKRDLGATQEEWGRADREQLGEEMRGRAGSEDGGGRMDSREGNTGKEREEQRKPILEKFKPE